MVALQCCMVSVAQQSESAICLHTSPLEPSILPIKVATEHQGELAIYAILHVVVYTKKKKKVC